MYPELITPSPFSPIGPYNPAPRHCTLGIEDGRKKQDEFIQCLNQNWQKDEAVHQLQKLPDLKNIKVSELSQWIKDTYTPSWLKRPKSTTTSLLVHLRKIANLVGIVFLGLAGYETWTDLNHPAYTIVSQSFASTFNPPGHLRKGKIHFNFVPPRLTQKLVVNKVNDLFVTAIQYVVFAALSFLAGKIFEKIHQSRIIESEKQRNLHEKSMGECMSQLVEWYTPEGRQLAQNIDDKVKFIEGEASVLQLNNNSTVKTHVMNYRELQAKKNRYEQIMKELDQVQELPHKISFYLS